MCGRVGVCGLRVVCVGGGLSCVVCVCCVVLCYVVCCVCVCVCVPFTELRFGQIVFTTITFSWPSFI